MKKNILIIQHHGKFGGATKSISEYIINLKNVFSIDVLCPSGTTFEYFKKKKINTFKISGIPKYDITEIGSYNGLRKLLILREIFYLPIFLFALYGLSKKKYDIIHLNDTNLLIVAPILKFFFKSKIICHVRTRIDKNNIPYLIRMISKRIIYKFICIDQSTYATSIEKRKSEIIYNIYIQKKKISKKLNKKFITIGFLGTLDFHKGLDFLFNCIKEINKINNNFRFIIGGDLSVKNSLILKITQYLNIKKNFNNIYYDFKKNNFRNVHFIGPVNNLQNFYNKIDVMCFPSRMNALGRPVIEASSFKIPSIVCLKDYYSDTIVNQKTGFVIKFGDTKKMLKLFNSFKRNRIKIILMGKNARNNFDLRHNANNNLKKLTKIYLEK